VDHAQYPIWCVRPGFTSDSLTSNAMSSAGSSIPRDVGLASHDPEIPRGKVGEIASCACQVPAEE
jgi:hypothetical protein